MKHLFSIALFLAASAAIAKPTVSVDSTVQNGDGSVTINYKLSGEPAIVCFDIQTNSVSVGGRNLRRVAGDVNRIVALKHDFATPYSGTIRWFPYGTELLRKGFSLDASVTAQVSAYATNCPPDYMTVNIGLPNGYWQWPSRGYGLRFYPDVESLPGGLESPRYRETVVVMRKIPAKDVVWRRGAPNISGIKRDGDRGEFNFYMKLTRDFYLGVFPVTHNQMMAVRSADSEHIKRSNYEKMSDYRAVAAYQMSYNALRGQEANAYETSTAPKASSVLGLLNKRMGMAFDLPTSLEWEFACRSGTSGQLYNSSSEVWAQADLDKIAWNQHNYTNVVNGVTVTSSHPVGLLEPNKWSLYDMMGNYFELCRDFCPNNSEMFAALGGKGWKKEDPAVNPVLLTLPSDRANPQRCRVGGQASDSPNSCRASCRWAVPDNSGWAALRLYCPAEF